VPTSSKKGSKWARFNRVMVPYYFLIPAAVILLCFAAYPVLNVFYFSTRHYNPNKPWIEGFAGLQNYVQILTSDKLFRSSLLISVRWCFIQVTLQCIFGMIFALVLNAKFRGRGIVRALIFAPWALSGVMVSILWQLIYHQNIGVLSDLMVRLGLIQSPIAWVANPKYAFGSVVVAELWRGIPFFAISLLAAMQNIPGELYESCDIDGGGLLAKFRFIVLPFLKDTIVLTTLLRFVWEFNAVDLIRTLTGGGPMNLTTTLSLYLADTAIKTQNFGYGSAIGTITFFLMLGLAITYIKVSGYGKGQDQ